MNNISKLTEELSKLTIVEAAQLVKALQKKWGVENISMPNTAVASESSQTTKATKNTVDVIIHSAGDKKIQIIKMIKEITSLGLKDAKALIDAAPKAIKKNISASEAEKIKTMLEKCGASIEIK